MMCQLVSYWAYTKRELSAWRSNELEHKALRRIYRLATTLKASKELFMIKKYSGSTSKIVYLYSLY